MLSKLKIVPNLWFDGQAEEAARFYTGIFRNSGIDDITYYGNEGQEIHHMPEGTVLTVEFTLDGQPFLALNGGPEFKFNEAVSFVVSCDNQEEVDYYWDKLGAGGDPQARQCGWLKDKYGLSWQVVPKILPQMLKDRDKTRAERVMAAMLKMKKIEIGQLQQAYNSVEQDAYDTASV